MSYAIEFDYGEGQIVYAGMHKGALGWAPTLRTAIIWADRKAAQRTLDNGYGNFGRQYGKVIEIEK